tara:strand:- start:1168 stop:2154 length:987 start_codon:yes stop_codon:yes gene_type:complete
MINLSNELITNIDLINKLISLFEKKNLPSSIIFSGPKGIGKATSAFYLVSKLLVNDPNKNYNKLIYSNTHPNVKYLVKEFDEKTGKHKNYISVNQIRKLDNFIYQSSFENLPKFIIIDSSDDLNNNSSNALLKILEEPKPNTFFIIISNQISSLLPTIRSRSINFNFNAPNIDEFEKILSMNDINEIDNFNFLYKFSNKSPGIALQINSDKLNNLYSTIINILKLNDELISDELIELSEYVKNFTIDEYKIFIMILKFILLENIKNNLGFINKNDINIENLNIDNNLNNLNYFNIIDFLNENEKYLYTYNLDKKIFCLNIFNSIHNNK